MDKNQVESKPLSHLASASLLGRRRLVKHDKLFNGDADFDEWWANIDSRVEKKTFSENEADICKYSVIMKSFRNEFETDNLISQNAINLLKGGILDFNKKMPAKTSVEMLVPGYNSNSFIPNTSCLTFTEMYSCFITLYGNAPPNQFRIDTWKKCQEKLEQEQAEYIAFAKNQWLADHSKRHDFINANVKEYVDLLWKVRLEKVANYPKYYALKESIRLADSNKQFRLEFVKQLDEIGRPALYYLPDLWTFIVNINSVMDCLEKPTTGWNNDVNKKKCNSFYKSIHTKLTERGYHSDVSSDEVAEKLAQENGVDVVMSSSAFSYLIDHQPAGVFSEWHLPVTVREYQIDSKVKKIVFIDKKLPAMSMTALERNKYFAKIALKKLLIKPPQIYRNPTSANRKGNSLRYSKKNNCVNCRQLKTMESKNIDEADNIYDADSVETFGVEITKKKILNKNCANCRKQKILETKIVDDQQLNKSCKKNVDIVDKRENSDSDQSDCLYIDADECEKVKKKDCEFGGAVNEKVNSTSTTTSQFSCSESSDKDNNKDFKSANKKRLKYKVVYNFWYLYSSDCQHCLKLLIRTTIEGYSKEKKEKLDEPITKLYKLSPKLEYQSEFGAEAVTISESLRSWASLYIRPFTLLARVRINALSGELIQTQILNVDQIAKECQRLHGFDPETRLATLHNSLSKLTTLSPGFHFLSHRPHAQSFVELYSNVTNNVGDGLNFNLQNAYSMVDMNSVAPARAAVPVLDPHVLTPTFERFKRVPCSFVSKKQATNKSLLRDNKDINPPAPASSKKKKKKNKKKK